MKLPTKNLANGGVRISGIKINVKKKKTEPQQRRWYSYLNPVNWFRKG